jgi:pyruvate/2-oxoglutarate dehydrogenase complex dihydrolipoamide acyltransferase (E2) component
LSEITVPKWGLTIDDAVLVSWHISVGDAVVIDQPVAVVETDKAEMEIESLVQGSVTELLVQAGESVVPGQVIAIVAPS